MKPSACSVLVSQASPWGHCVALTVIWPGGKFEVARGPKIDVARQLIALIASRLPPPDGSPRRGARKRRSAAALPRDRVRARRARR